MSIEVREPLPTERQFIKETIITYMANDIVSIGISLRDRPKLILSLHGDKGYSQLDIDRYFDDALAEAEDLAMEMTSVDT